MVTRVETGPGEVTVFLSGELDHHAARPLREQIDGIAIRCHAKKLRLDFESVPFMDSSGIGLIMGRYKTMQSLGGELCVTGTSDRLWSIMRLAGLERLPIFPQQKGDLS